MQKDDDLLSLKSQNIHMSFQKRGNQNPLVRRKRETVRRKKRTRPNLKNYTVVEWIVIKKCLISSKSNLARSLTQSSKVRETSSVELEVKNFRRKKS